MLRWQLIVNMYFIAMLKMCSDQQCPRNVYTFYKYLFSPLVQTAEAYFVRKTQTVNYK